MSRDNDKEGGLTATNEMLSFVGQLIVPGLLGAFITVSIFITLPAFFMYMAGGTAPDIALVKSYVEYTDAFLDGFETNRSFDGKVIGTPLLGFVVGALLSLALKEDRMGT